MWGVFDVFMDYGIFIFFWWFIVFIGSLVVLVFIFFIGVIGILFWFIFYFIVVVLVFKRKLKYECKVVVFNFSMIGFLVDNLSNVMMIKIFGVEKWEEGYF